MNLSSTLWKNMIHIHGNAVHHNYPQLWPKKEKITKSKSTHDTALLYLYLTLLKLYHILRPMASAFGVIPWLQPNWSRLYWSVERSWRERKILLWLTASSKGNTFLPIYVTLWVAQNQSNNCKSYPKGFPTSGISISYSCLPKFIAYTSFLWTLQICLHYKCVPYLTQSVSETP